MDSDRLKAKLLGTSYATTLVAYDEGEYDGDFVRHAAKSQNIYSGVEASTESKMNERKSSNIFERNEAATESALNDRTATNRFERNEAAASAQNGPV